MKFFRRRTFRTTLQTSAVSIQPLERVSTSANNWGGASQTVVELIKDLDVELSQLDTDGTDILFTLLHYKIRESHVNS
jgi:hypothetical protein